MTSNQIAFQRYVEDARHNVQTEYETQRSNVTREIETGRTNRVYEGELWRSNTAREAENLRSALAREAENLRSNRARESELYRSNTAHENETNRSNVTREKETNRANLKGEDLELQANEFNLAKNNPITASIHGGLYYLDKFMSGKEQGSYTATDFFSDTWSDVERRGQEFGAGVDKVVNDKIIPAIGSALQWMVESSSAWAPTC